MIENKKAEDNKSYSLHVYSPKDVYEYVVEQSAKQGLSISTYVTNLITDKMKSEG